MIDKITKLKIYQYQVSKTLKKKKLKKYKKHHKVLGKYIDIKV